MLAGSHAEHLGYDSCDDSTSLLQVKEVQDETDSAAARRRRPMPPIEEWKAPGADNARVCHSATAENRVLPWVDQKNDNPGSAIYSSEGRCRSRTRIGNQMKGSLSVQDCAEECFAFNPDSAICNDIADPNAITTMEVFPDFTPAYQENQQRNWRWFAPTCTHFEFKEHPTNSGQNTCRLCDATLAPGQQRLLANQNSRRRPPNRRQVHALTFDHCGTDQENCFP